MADLARRFESNPILTPDNIYPSMDGLNVEGVLNPGAFRFQGKTWLVMRVAQRPTQTGDKISTPVYDPESDRGIKILEFDFDDPDIELTDTRGFRYKGRQLLTTLSHLQLASSDDGIHFIPDAYPLITGEGPQETFGVEDCRVARVGTYFVLAFTAVSPDGFGIKIASTTDWENFQRHPMILPPSNKDFALFEQQIGGFYVAMHRPSPMFIGDNNIWISKSRDLLQWGAHECIARVRPGHWDSERIGAGASPIKTPAGWLEIYHGANDEGRYCLGALLLDSENPSKVLARSDAPIMEPTEEYELEGFYGETIFTCGHVVDGNEITMYYGAADSVICGAKLSIPQILDSMTSTL